MTPQVSIITAVAPYHQDVAQRAIDSAQAQTVPVTVMTAYDEHMRGPGYARNRALERVTTEFVTFLDADDWIEPNYIEKCLSIWQQDHYVYSDWLEDAAVKTAPDCPYTNKTWHPITTLIPTEWVRRVGAFSEGLAGAEDTRLYLSLITSGCCGIHLKEPLFHYGAEGRRARQFMQSPAYAQTMEIFTQEFGRIPMTCCGDNVPQDQNLPEGLPGDVIVQAVWSGNRMERGPISGRLYERTGNGKLTKVDPRDQMARPDLWRLVSREPIVVKRPATPFVPLQSPEPVTINTPPLAVETAKGAAQAALHGSALYRSAAAPLSDTSTAEPLRGVGEVAAALWNTNAPVDVEKMIAVKPAKVAPDVGALARLTGQAAKQQVDTQSRADEAALDAVDAAVHAPIEPFELKRRKPPLIDDEGFVITEDMPETARSTERPEPLSAQKRKRGRPRKGAR